MIDFTRNQYRATIIRHVDADTTHVVVDPGFDLSVRMTVRWARINAPELSTEEGKLALAYVNKRLPQGMTCLLTTVKDGKDKYGRYLGEFWVDGTSINDELVHVALAAPYLSRITTPSED